MVSSRFEQLDAAGYELAPSLVERLLTPALVVYLDRVRGNLRRVIRHTGDEPNRWRPHIKTTKIPEIFVEMTEVGLRNFKCATTREAKHLLEVLERQQVEDGDLLVAFPLIGPALERLAGLARRHPRTRVSVLCEDPDAVETIPAAVSVFADVNPGMNRTGVPLEQAGQVVEIAQRCGERFRGVHFYDGHIGGGNAAARREQAFACYDRLLDLVARLESSGCAVGELITSGTPSFLYALAYEPFARSPMLHRVSPGTVVYHDLGYEQQIEDLELSPAAMVLTRVVSHPTEGIVTCDAGSKAIAAEAGDPCAYVLGHPGLEALRPSEEHLPLRVRAGARPPRGTPLLLIPRHVCPTVNLAEQAILVEAGRLREVVPVRARAHELLADSDNG